MAAHGVMTGVDLGLIRPEHLTDGWRLDQDRHGWGMSKPLPGGLRVRIYPTTATTVAWTVCDSHGTVLREASCRDVEITKAAVEQWIQDHTASADRIPWRPTMETVLEFLADVERARTVLMIQQQTGLGVQPIRNALEDLVRKGVVTHQGGKPASYRINDYGQRLVARNPERFGL